MKLLRCTFLLTLFSFSSWATGAALVQDTQDFISYSALSIIPVIISALLVLILPFFFIVTVKYTRNEDYQANSLLYSIIYGLVVFALLAIGIKFFMPDAASILPTNTLTNPFASGLQPTAPTNHRTYDMVAADQQISAGNITVTAASVTANSSTAIMSARLIFLESELRSMGADVLSLVYVCCLIVIIAIAFIIYTLYLRGEEEKGQKRFYFLLYGVALLALILPIVSTFIMDTGVVLPTTMPKNVPGYVVTTAPSTLSPRAHSANQVFTAASITGGSSPGSTARPSYTSDPLPVAGTAPSDDCINCIASGGDYNGDCTAGTGTCVKSADCTNCQLHGGTWHGGSCAAGTGYCRSLYCEQCEAKGSVWSGDCSDPTDASGTCEHPNCTACNGQPNMVYTGDCSEGTHLCKSTQCYQCEDVDGKVWHGDCFDGSSTSGPCEDPVCTTCNATSGMIWRGNCRMGTGMGCISIDCNDCLDAGMTWDGNCVAGTGRCISTACATCEGAGGTWDGNCVTGGGSCRTAACESCESTPGMRYVGHGTGDCSDATGDCVHQDYYQCVIVDGGVYQDPDPTVGGAGCKSQECVDCESAGHTWDGNCETGSGECDICRDCRVDSDAVWIGGNCPTGRCLKCANRADRVPFLSGCYSREDDWYEYNSDNSQVRCVARFDCPYSYQTRHGSWHSVD